MKLSEKLQYLQKARLEQKPKQKSKTPGEITGGNKQENTHGTFSSRQSFLQQFVGNKEPGGSN